MSSSEPSAAQRVVPAAIVDGDELRSLSNQDLQWLLARAAKEYAHRQQEGDQFPVFGVEQASVGLAATDAVIVASAVLDALSVEIFELGMWKTWGGV